MSYFGSALTELLERKKMTAARLSEISGVDAASISRYRKGERSWISPEDLAAIAKHASDDPRDRAGLIKAHLLDGCAGPGSELIEISVRGVQEFRDIPSRNQIPLRADAEENFRILREWYSKDPNVRQIVDNLGELLREPNSPSKEDKTGKGRGDTERTNRATFEAYQRGKKSDQK